MNAKELNNMEKELENINDEGSVIQEPVEAPVDEVETEMVQVEVKTEEVSDDIITVISETETEEISEVKAEIVPEVRAAEIINVPVVEAEKVRAKSNKRILQGKVVSNKGDKTIIIKVVRQVSHPIYKKYYKKTNKFMAHDENNICNIGDTVKVKECRPLSARKCWELVEVVEKAK
jgi:small subunit ribosomal protein S17